MKKNNNRIKVLKKHLSTKSIDAFFISDINNVRYLSNFTGSTAYIILSNDRAYFFTDGRYEAQCKTEIDDTEFTTVILNNYNHVIEKYLSNYNKILVEKTLSIFLYDMIMQSVQSTALVDIDIEDTVLTMRSMKDEDEIILIKEQYNIAAKSFNEALSSFKYGERELDWAASLSYYIMRNGAIGESFDTIVASGYRGAMPHGVATDKIICDEAVIIDFGSRTKFNSDYTRMVYSGNDSEVLKVIDIVYTALKKAIDFIKVGVKASEIDNVARSYIEEKGFGKFFNHSLGHGVGLDVHELPIINSRSERVIDSGMVFTIEPGIYLPGSFGVRLEDTVLIYENSVEVLSSGLDQYTYKLK